MKTLKYLALAAALALATGCGDDEEPIKADAATPGVTDGGAKDMAAPAGDAGVPGDGAVTPDGGMPAPDGGGGTGDGGVTTIGLVDFVTGLVTGSTTATAVPVSLDDKTVTDTTDPAAFDKLLGP
jgi:hypothetical protein